MQIDLDPVDRLTAGAVGAPGERVFYLQGRKGDHLVTVLVEKQQVQLLAASVVEILSRVGKETGKGPADEAMELEEPLLPEWRAGRLAIGYHEDRDLLLLEVDELVPGEDDDEEEDGNEEEEEAGELAGLARELGITPLEDDEETSNGHGGSQDDDGEPVPLDDLVDDLGPEGEEPDKVRFWATREQMLSLARRGASVCAAGRPRCQLCGNPIGPEGHRCPALNGHHEPDEA